MCCLTSTEVCSWSCFHCFFLIRSGLFFLLSGSLLAMVPCSSWRTSSDFPAPFPENANRLSVRSLIFFFVPHTPFAPHLEPFSLGLWFSLSLLPWSIILGNYSSFGHPDSFSLKLRQDYFLSRTRCTRSLTSPQFAIWQFSTVKGWEKQKQKQK